MRAIDVHVHPSTRGLDAHACSYFRRDLADVPKTAEGFAALYAQHDVQALLIGWHPSTVREGARNTNEHVLELASSYPKSFAGVLAQLNTSIGRTSTDPLRAEGIRDATWSASFRSRASIR